MKCLPGLLILLLASFSLFGQDQTEVDLYDLTLEELLNMKVKVASKKAVTTRESPGILTVITEEEISASGARDLIDVLRLVPGLNFSYDVQGVVGLSARGNWGHEGKILLMINGLELNENAFSTTQFGNHYCVDQIKKIEVIRGPGTSVYGGYAELGVINIVTKDGKDLEGMQLTATTGISENVSSRNNLSLQFGQSNQNIEFYLNGFLGKAIRSTDQFTDLFGKSRDMTNNSDLKPQNIGMGIKYRNISLQTNYDHYRTTTTAYFDMAADTVIALNFESWNSQVAYDWKLNDKVTISPKFSFVHQKPWNTSYNKPYQEDYLRNTIGTFYDITVTKTTGNITGSADISDNLNLIFGAEYFLESGKNNDPIRRGVFLDGKETINFNTISGFGQLLHSSTLGNFTVGGRIINHNQFGSAFAPRIGYNKLLNRFHLKLLYSRAFRAPGIENINLNRSVVPEKTDVAEIEVGYKLAKTMFATVNVFDIVIKDPIIYFYDDINDVEAYLNFEQSGSRGIELEYKIKQSWGFLNFNYSYYSTAGKNKADLYQVPIDRNSVLGIPKYKINVYSSLKASSQFSVNPSVTFLGERYGYATMDSQNNPVLSSFSSTPLINLNLRYKNLLVSGLTVSFSAYDLLDEQIEFIQPYNGMHAPLPGLGREFLLKIDYRLEF